jgi:signal transduction histidine kinase
MMTILSKFNSIAARIAFAIVFSIILTLVVLTSLSVALDHYGYEQDSRDSGARTHVVITRSNLAIVNPRRNPMLLSGRIAVVIRSVALAPPSEQQGIVAAIADPDMQVVLDAPVLPDAAGPQDEYTDRLRQFVQMQLESLSPPIPVSARTLAASDGRAGRAVVNATLQDGRRLAFTIAYDRLASNSGLIAFLLSIVVVATLVSIWMARRIAAPIREFAGAAERLGLDLTAPPLAVRGPWELRATIETVNRMQHRLHRFLEDRTEMLAAISHDLRAPLARLRLRAELVADGEQQRKMFEDLDSMNAMIESTLAFARDNARQEPRTLVDLGVLVGDVCEDAGDSGEKVAYAGQRGIDIPCRPTHIRRAVANLIDNAVKYGESARVKIVHEADRVVIVIDDDGPGIPADEQERVFWPFYRREAARDPAKAGVGLGLSIARTVAREHGGDVTLRNRDGGGLSALIELPV